MSFFTSTPASVKRKLKEMMSIKQLFKSILIGFFILQISFLFFSSPIPDNLNENQIVDTKHALYDMSKETFKKNNEISEKRFGERQIKSFKEYSESHDISKKIHFQDSKTKQDSIEENSLFLAHGPGHSNKQQSSNIQKNRKDSVPLCPRKPPNLIGRLPFKFNSTPPTLQEVANNNPNLESGGFYKPPDCISRSRIAFIIPHRARELHLRALLWHIHPIFQRQQLYYKVYVVHQAGNLAFNKAKLMNIGFLEAMKDDDYDCIVFHDVDLLPEDDRLLYSCKDTPKHLSVAIDKYGYRLPYTSLFGGVTMLSMDQFRDVNGYSNMYWGWGGEDDDMFNRIFSRGYTIKRPPFHLARYKMSFHHRDKGNRLNLMRFEILSRSVNRMQEDGLNNVKYTITHLEKTPVYTNITADVGTAVIQCKPYLSDWTCGFVLWMCEHLTLSCGMLQYNSTDDGTLTLPLNINL